MAYEVVNARDDENYQALLAYVHTLEGRGGTYQYNWVWDDATKHKWVIEARRVDSSKEGDSHNDT